MIRTLRKHINTSVGFIGATVIALVLISIGIQLASMKLLLKYRTLSGDASVWVTPRSLSNLSLSNMIYSKSSLYHMLESAHFKFITRNDIELDTNRKSLPNEYVFKGMGDVIAVWRVDTGEQDVTRHITEHESDVDLMANSLSTRTPCENEFMNLSLRQKLLVISRMRDIQSTYPMLTDADHITLPDRSALILYHASDDRPYARIMIEAQPQLGNLCHVRWAAIVSSDSGVELTRLSRLLVFTMQLEN